MGRTADYWVYLSREHVDGRLHTHIKASRRPGTDHPSVLAEWTTRATTQEEAIATVVEWLHRGRPRDMVVIERTLPTRS